MLDRFGVFDQMFQLVPDFDGLVLRRPAGAASWRGAFTPPVSCFTRDKQLVVRMELPGVNPDEIEVTVAEDRLTISGEKKRQSEVKEADVHFYGDLPRPVREVVRAAGGSQKGPGQGLAHQRCAGGHHARRGGRETVRRVPIESAGPSPKAIKAA